MHRPDCRRRTGNGAFCLVMGTFKLSRRVVHEVSSGERWSAALENFRTGILGINPAGFNAAYKVDGLEVARCLRRRGTGNAGTDVNGARFLARYCEGLDAGADDYLTKPFSFVELLARMRALLRRKEFRRKNVLEVDDLVLDLTSHRSFRNGVEIYLSLTEFRLLELLARNTGRIVSRHEILNKVWGAGREVSENTLDAFVRLLRKKVDTEASAKLIHTHRGFGYSVGQVIGL